MLRHRTASRLAVLGLLGGALVPLTAAPAGATPGCLEETAPSVLQNGCDDSTPPETTLTPSTTPNAAGLVAVSSMTFTLGSQVSDGDPGPFALECRLTGGPQAHDWRACTSPVTYADLPDAAAGTYVLEARAVDAGDRARTPDTAPLLPPTVPDTPDEDPTPATFTWGQDTRAPFVFVTGASVPIRLNSSEAGSRFECTDNDQPVACTGGRWELPDPAAGRHRFSARTVDAAGNVSAWSPPIEFFVPRDLTRQRGWRKVTGPGYVRGDAVKASRRGARLVLPRAKLGELRLLAATGRGHGKVRVRVGRRAWQVVDLAGPRTSSTQHVVIDRYSGLRTGRIVIETLSARPVVLDAVVARPNRFPAAQR